MRKRSIFFSVLDIEALVKQQRFEKYVKMNHHVVLPLSKVLLRSQMSGPLGFCVTYYKTLKITILPLRKVMPGSKRQAPTL